MIEQKEIKVVVEWGMTTKNRRKAYRVGRIETTPPLYIASRLTKSRLIDNSLVCSYDKEYVKKSLRATVCSYDNCLRHADCLERECYLQGEE